MTKPSDKCPCGSSFNFESCCAIYLNNRKLPPTPEALMRSRYTAYSMANIDYIQETMRGKAAVGFIPLEAAKWAKRVSWRGLKVINSFLENDHKGYVEFIATFVDGDQIESIHERSEFRYEQGKWYYVDGGNC